MRIQPPTFKTFQAMRAGRMTPQQKRALLAIRFRDRELKPLAGHYPIKTSVEGSASLFFTYVRRDRIPPEVMEPKGTFHAYFKKKLAALEGDQIASQDQPYYSFTAGGTEVRDHEGANVIGFLLVVRFGDLPLTQIMADSIQATLKDFYQREIRSVLRRENRGNIFPYWQ